MWNKSTRTRNISLLLIAALGLTVGHACGAMEMAPNKAADHAMAPMEGAAQVEERRAARENVPMLPPKPEGAVDFEREEKLALNQDLAKKDAAKAPVAMEPQAAPAMDMAEDEDWGDAGGMAEPMAIEAQAAGVEWLWEVDDEVWDGGGGEWGGGGDWGGPGGGMPMPVQPAYATVRQFPVPDYSQAYDGPRVDFRETVYWRPDVYTDGNGMATVSFYLNDSVTSFRAVVEGLDYAGSIGRGDHVVGSKLPVSLAAKLPLEVTRGDVIQLPVTISNETNRPQIAKVSADIGPAFELLGVTGLGNAASPESLALGANERKSFFYSLQVVGDGFDPTEGKLSVKLDAANLTDQIERTVKVVPEGFPFELAAAGTLEKKSAKHTFIVDNPLDGTLLASVELYPSPVDQMIGGMESMIRQPGGCFEQASSSNYPNIMILQYMETYEEVDADLLDRTKGHLDAGYNLLTGYETPDKGYEWFGSNPGHEALSAYGLLEFVEMSEVYEVDQGMVDRTADWLLSRRDGKGGFERSAQALDSFGRASEEVTNAYIIWSLTEAGYAKELDEEIEYIEGLAKDSKDAYVLALAANTLLEIDPKSKKALKALDRLVDTQGKDGAFTQTDHSITRSGGISLAVETTSLATLAMLKGKREADQSKTDDAVKFIQSQNNGWGGFGATQSTILGLKALTTYAESSAGLPEGTEIVVMINGEQATTITYKEKGEELAIAGLEKHLQSGKNTVELKVKGGDDIKLPYSIRVTYRSTDPVASKESVVHIDTKLKSNQVALGETVRMNVEVSNITKKGQPMALARVGLPGGLTFQTWQLKELREKGVIDFYETREREVILYWRALAPEDVKRVDLDLMAQVPGTYQATPSTAYLYYTDEHKDWTEPVSVEVRR